MGLGGLFLALYPQQFMRWSDKSANKDGANKDGANKDRANKD
jgi:hypothetical protein